MLLKTGFYLCVLIISQVVAEKATPVFIEDALKNVEAGENAQMRIVSGWEAYPGQHPHQAALRMINAVGGVSACGGSIVHREWVITAAHCTAAQITLVVRAGVTNLTLTEYIFETNEWYNYPSYDDTRPSVVQPNDISLVKLQRPVVYSRLLQAIQLQSSADAHKNYAELVVYASGHGMTWTSGATTEVLNWVYLRGVANAECALNFGTALINDNAICARFFNITSQSTCQGDSGGPLVHVNDDGTPVLIGVASFVAGGNFGCHSGFPAGFIRIGPFHNWYYQVTGIDFENLEEDVTETPEQEETTTTPTPPTEPDVDPEEPEDESDEDDSVEDPELSEVLKKLEVKVKVKVQVNKNKIKKKVHIKKKIPA